MNLLKKLSAAKFDTSLFRSSKNLGAVRTSKRAAPDQIASRPTQVKVDRESFSPLDGDLSSDDGSSSSGEASSPPSLKSHPEDTVVSNTVPPSAVTSVPNLGSGLKRPLEVDEEGIPVMTKRQRSNSKPELSYFLDELSWDGFDSATDSAADSSNSADDSEDESSSFGSASASDETGTTGSDASLSDMQPLPLFAFGNGGALQVPKRIISRVNSDFTSWATQQINEARDFIPSRPVVDADVQGGQELPQSVNCPQKRLLEQDPLPPELEISPHAVQREAFSVKVERSAEIQNARIKLPIVAEEQKIMEAVHNNPVTIVCGATGSGKTTQVPQFLYEAGYGNPDGPNPGMIGVTQPRRVAAVTVAKRVGEELCDHNASSYQIRFDSTVSQRTAIKFMTDGILVREISQDFSLERYCAIIIDEAHERSVNTDILIGLISRIVTLRAKLSDTSQGKPLKLIIMSATLMTDSFLSNSHLFPREAQPPLVESEGRQHPVTVHFARQTQREYVDDALRKIVNGHRKLPPGGMLCFLTSQSEIADLARKLAEKLSAPQLHGLGRSVVRFSGKDTPMETDDLEIGGYQTDDVDSELDSQVSEDDEEDFGIEESEEASSKALVLPLYSQLPTKEQLRVFQPPPPNTRLIILATNVAETSITIPGVRYVIDCGRSKEKTYDKSTGVQSYEVEWISKASAAQRTGRAGRTGPGHCYRLYSSAVYERDFAEHTAPEILRTPVEGVVLQLKSLGLKNTPNFPFPDAPDRQAILKGERLLGYLGALDHDGVVTPLGRDLSIYPLSPRFAKMIAIGHQQDCMYYTAALVASLSIPELFIPEAQLNLNSIHKDDEEVYSSLDHAEDSAREQRKKKYNETHYSFSAHDRHSDAIKLLSAFCSYNWAAQSEDVDSFCTRHFLRAKAMKEATQLYQQLLRIISANGLSSLSLQNATLKPPSKTQVAALKQIVACGFIDQVAIRADLAPQPPDMLRSPKRAIDVPYLTLFPIHEGKSEALESVAVFIHPSSVLAHVLPKDLPQYLVYSTLQRSAPSTIAGAKMTKTRMHPLTSINGSQLTALTRGTSLLEYGKPVGKIEDVKGEKDKRIAWVVPSLVGGIGGRAWPLPAVKVLQKKDRRGDWIVERMER